MKQPNNKFTIGLIALSVTLLVALQVFWLQQVFVEAKTELRKDVSYILQKTLFSLQDSLIQQNIHSLPRDSSDIKNVGSELKALFIRRPLTDSLGDLKAPIDISKRIEISFSGNEVEGDSIRSLLRPLAWRLRKDTKHKNFIFRMTMDSLRISEIQNKYNNALLKADIFLTGKVKRIKGEGVGFAEQGTSILTDPINVSPFDSYVSYFDNTQSYLLGKIKLEILFSIFLTIVIVTAFIIMYQSIRSQQRLMKLKNDFISNMTHELKTPVTTVGVALEALQNFKGLDNPQLTREYLDIAQNELKRLTVLTDTILKTAIFESNGVAFVPEPVAFDELIDQVIGSMKLVLEKKNAHVEFRKEGEHFMLQGGSAHLTSVIFNLLDNALKYSKESPSILIQLKDSDNKLTLTIQDNGVGIPIEYRKKIFEKFFRVPTGDIHNIKGYGLGLSYVEGVIKEHGGTIDLVSEVGKGSTFRITLPK